jgi:predicted lipoprotein with Yx(FWY)xxD motif
MTARHRKTARRAAALLVAGLVVLALARGAAQVRAQDSTTVMIADAGGTLILTGANGMTLYIFDRDSAGMSACTGGCAMTWPPLLLAEGDPVPPADLPGVLAVITRADGGRQVTYNDMPLYFYARDQRPGDTTGDGVGGVWHLAKP